MEKTLGLNLWKILITYRKRYLKAALLVFISNVLIVCNPLIFRQALSSLPKDSTSLNTLFYLLPWVAILLFISVLAALLKYLMRMEFMSISREVETDVRSELFIRIQQQSRAFFDHHGIGELLSRLTNDVMYYRDLLGFGIMYPIFFATLVVPSLAALFYISVPLTFLALVPIIFIPVLNAIFRNPMFKTSHLVQKLLGDLSNFTQEAYAGIRIIKSYAIENSMFKRFRTMCRHFAKINFRLAILQGVVFPLFTLVARATTLGLVIFAGFIILKAWSHLDTADFLSFMWIQSYLFFPLLMLGWVLPIYERGRAAYARLVEVYDEPIEVSDNATSTLAIPPDADIVFRRLTFSYPGTEKPILSNLSLHINPGTFVGITGPVGSGKSTLFRLINREYEVPKETLFIGGHEIHKYSLEAIHKEIVLVEQASFLFSRSLAENVRFGDQEASQEQLEMAAQFADLHDTVMGFPEQYNTQVGERGVTLSGGQKQRVAIARTFLLQKSIILLDDIFSALDFSTEKRVFAAIKEHFSGKTVLLITPRVSILEKMDRILYMSQGKVVEDGTHQELIKMKGYYAALAELQQLK